MKIILLASERVFIPEFVPKEGSLIEQLTARDIVQKTKLQPEEHLKLKFFQVHNRVELSDETDFEKEIDLDKSEIEMLKDGYSKLDRDKKITIGMVTLAKKIRDLTAPTFTQETKEKLKK